MKFFHIDAIIDKDLLNRFLDFCNANSEDDWTIILFTVGGLTVMAKTITYTINQRKERVTLICNEAYSAGFVIFYKSKCKKILCENAKGMLHLSAAKIEMQSNCKPSYSEDVCIMKNWKESNKEFDYVNEFMTKKEIENFKKGNDVYFTFKRMCQIFPDAEII